LFTIVSLHLYNKYLQTNDYEEVKNINNVSNIGLVTMSFFFYVCLFELYNVGSSPNIIFWFYPIAGFVMLYKLKDKVLIEMSDRKNY
jgi:hypothetical protein